MLVRLFIINFVIEMIEAGCYISNAEAIAVGLAIPFVGTTVGAACVYLMRGELPVRLEKCLTGFAAGVMTAAAVWSLLFPAMEIV